MNIKEETFCRNDYSSFNDFYEAVKGRINEWQNQASPSKRWCFFGYINDELFTDKKDFLDSLQNHFLDEKLCVTIKLLDGSSGTAKELLDGLNLQGEERLFKV